MQTQYPYSNAYSTNQCQSFLSISHLNGTLDFHFQFLRLIPEQFFPCLCDNFVFSAAQAPNYLLVLFFFHSLIPFYHISCPIASDHSHHYHTSPYDCHLVAEVIAKVSSSKIRSLSLSSKTSHGSLPLLSISHCAPAILAPWSSFLLAKHAAYGPLHLTVFSVWTALFQIITWFASSPLLYLYSEVTLSRKPSLINLNRRGTLPYSFWNFLSSFPAFVFSLSLISI